MDFPAFVLISVTTAGESVCDLSFVSQHVSRAVRPSCGLFSLSYGHVDPISGSDRIAKGKYGNNMLRATTDFWSAVNLNLVEPYRFLSL